MEKLENLKDLDKIKKFKSKYKQPELILSPTQKLIYGCCIKGLKAYSEECVRKMTYSEKTRILNRQNLAWQIINELKQDKLNTLIRITIKKIIPNICGSAAPILLEPIVDPNFNITAIKELSISTEKIIKELIKNKLVPENFYEL